MELFSKKENEISMSKMFINVNYKLPQIPLLGYVKRLPLHLCFVSSLIYKYMLRTWSNTFKTCLSLRKLSRGVDFGENKGINC